MLDRIIEITNNYQVNHPHFEPPYFYQIPLEFVPKVGKQTLNKLITAFGSEMIDCIWLQNNKLLKSSEKKLHITSN